MSSQPVIYIKHASWTGVVCAALAGLSACGGGGGGSSSPPAPTWTMGVFQPSTHYVAQCQVPRAGTDPNTGKPAYVSILEFDGREARDAFSAAVWAAVERKP